MIDDDNNLEIKLVLLLLRIYPIEVVSIGTKQWISCYKCGFAEIMGHTALFLFSKYG